MSKRNSDGDVLTNKVNLALAKHQKFLSTLLGPKTESDLHREKAAEQQEDKELVEDQVDPEKLGVGGVVPKDVQDGSFTRRMPTSDDKLLQQLIGKKAAKAHLAAKQATKTTAKPQRYGKSTTKKEESDDEEEGRAAMFKSKKPRPKKAQPVVEPEDDVDEETEDQAKSGLPVRPATNNDPEDVPAKAPLKSASKPTKDDSSEEGDSKPAKKPKTGSFLDELLAERSKKKKKKRGKGKGDAEGA